MTAPDPKREPKSETPEKKSILKTHEEFIGDMARPSISKQDYEKQQEAKRRRSANERTGEPPNREPKDT